MYEYKRFCATKPALAYDNTLHFADLQNISRQKLGELLGLPFEMCDADFEIEYKKERDDCTEYRFTVQTEPGYYIPCHLLRLCGSFVEKNTRNAKLTAAFKRAHLSGLRLLYKSKLVCRFFISYFRSQNIAILFTNCTISDIIKWRISNLRCKGEKL